MSAHDHAEHHVTPLRVYFGVYFTLLFLTIVTVGVSYLGLPASISIVVAMMVASVKAFFVGAWFMHLAHDMKFNVLFFITSFLFIGAFFFFTINDFATRDRVMKVQETFHLRSEKAEKLKVPTK